MQARAFNNWIRTPLLLMAIVEAAILYSSLYVAGTVVYGSVAECERLMGSVALKSSLLAALSLVALIAMGLYQFHQRFYYREAVLRIVVALIAAFVAAAVIFYAFPAAAIDRELANLAFGYSLVLLLGVRLFFVRTVDKNVFRRRTLVYGAGERAGSLTDFRRKADRRGFKIVGRVAAPGDTIIGDRSEVLLTGGQSIADIAISKKADEGGLMV